MICSACAHDNRPGAKFCEECATPLARACASCGAELRPTAKFCDECGAPTGASPRPATPPRASAGAAADSRKVVTIVFADLVGSTALHERLEPESARRFMESYYVAMRGAVESQGGTVTQLLGDGVKAVFGIPRVAEDDAIRAVRAAVAMQDAFRALADAQRGAVGKTGLRVAVNTGEVVANDATEIIGDPVNVAARLQEQGHDGDVVVGESTHRLVSTLVTLELLGSFALKGRSEAVKAYRVVSLDRPAGAATAPFVGRDEELARLSAVYETAVEKPAAGLAVLVGSPGLGKSRLIDEFARRHADAATVVRAHCDAAGGATFAPLAVALRELLGIEDGASADALRAAIEAALPGEDADRARIAGGVAALLAGSPASPEETFFVVRRMLGALAQRKPVVLVIDDLHWAESLLLDLVEHLIQWGSGVALFVLIGARPELRDLRSSLVTPGGFVADVVTLSGLDAGAAMRLAANVIGASDLPAAIAAKVLATSEGNPLFVGELVRMLVQEGALTREGERWVVGANLAALEMPPTIHALLAARIERLRPEERTVLERAAVVGRHFSRNAIAALLPREAGDLDARLEALRRSELIERDTGWLLGEPVLRFHHVLIRDAAYRRLLKGTRAELHAKLADWIETQVGDAAEHDETIGWHLEQAHAFLRELGPLDDTGKHLGERAAQRLAAAGRRALARDDLPVAADLLGRAIERLDAGDPARADLALDWCEALLAAGDVAPASAAIAELGRFSADSERLRAWHTCFVGQHTVLTAPSALNATAEAVAAAADELTALGDAAGEAKAHFVHALALSRLGKVGACEAALDRALAAARRAGDRRRANTVLAIAPLAALWGPSPVTRASGRCLDVVRVLRITQGAPAVEAVALSCQGVLEALRGRGDAARRMIAAARKMVEELGITQRLLEADVFGGLVELLEGDAAAAERNLRGAYDGLRDLGLGIDAARAAALLARALLAQDRVAEAEALSHESEGLAGDDLKSAIAWRGVRAEALARRGEHAAAVEFASKAVELAAATDALLDHADARLALAAALRAAGRGREADAEEGRARELWQAKGATLLAERASQTTAPVATPVAAAAPRRAHAPRRRAVQPNFAFEEMRRAEAAVAARDARALEAVYRRDVEIVDHQFGITYGYAEIVERVRAIIEDSTESAFAHEPLAGLGDSLALCRMRSTASGSTVHGIPVGATEVPYLLLIEADEQGSARHIEIFGDDKLGDAVVRLYERHAELLPDGPERARAAMTARSFAAVGWSGGDPVQRLPAVLASDFVGIDHRHLSNWSMRGAAAYIEHLRALRQVADDIEFRQIDVVALGPNAQLMRVLHTGTDRAGGGVYERPFLSLFVTDADGMLARGEWFDDDREAEALARFDALTAEPSAPRSIQRRVRPNAAIAMQAHFGTALAARDFEAIAAGFHESHQEIDHPTGSTYGRDACIASLQRLFRSRDPHYEFQPLATLGERLLLGRRHSGAGGAATGRYDVGAYENEAIQLFEVDECGLCCRAEVFAGDHLGDAIARLYQRNAELLPEGPERERAATTARGVAYLLTPAAAPDLRALFAPTYQDIDHRSVGYGALSPAEAQNLPGSLDEVAADVRYRVDDVLALTPDALVRRTTSSGVWRVGGGAFERTVWALTAFDRDGRVARHEIFDADREAEALARFDALVAGDEPKRRAQRQVQANAATRAFERFEATLAARDRDALAEHFDESLEVVHHPTRATYSRREMLTTWRSTLKAERFEFRQEILASLGDALALDHHLVSVEGLREAHLAAVGAAEFDEISLLEVDASGRWLRSEIFAADRLGDAVARFYERYAEQLPEGAARARAEVTARSVAVVAPGGFDRDRYAAVFRPDAEVADHKLLGLGSGVGPDLLFRSMAATGEVGDQLASRPLDVLALTPDALLMRWLASGVGRESGGAFEWAFLRLFVFDADGRVARYELFDDDREAEALARFDSLTTGHAELRRIARRVRANRASAAIARFDAACAAREIETAAAQHRADFEETDHPTGSHYGLDGARDGLRRLLRAQDPHMTHAPHATLGESLLLARRSTGASATAGGRFDVGAWVREEWIVAEADATERLVATEIFAHDRLGDAVVRLYERHAARQPDGPARMRAAGVAHAVAIVPGPIDLDRMASGFARDLRCADHRVFATWSSASGAELLEHFRLQLDLAPDFRGRVDEVLALESDGLLVRITYLGTSRDSGGAFENQLYVLYRFGADGCMSQIECFEAEHAAEALARFDALTGRKPEVPAEPFANTASRRVDRLIHRHWAAREWDGVLAAFSPAMRMDDRRRLVRLEIGYDEFVAQLRMLFDQPASRWRAQLLATRGERLSLTRTRFEADVADGGGPLAVDDHLGVTEIDAEGRIVAFVTFDLGDEDAAYAELDSRFEADPGESHGRVVGAFVRAVAARDWEAVAALCNPAFVEHDHRSLAVLGTTRGADAWMRNFRALVELAPDTIYRSLHVRTAARGFLSAGTWQGSREGGRYEIPLVAVLEVDASGAIARADLYEPDQQREALARFAELGGVAAQGAAFENAASATAEPLIAAVLADDWARYATLFSETLRGSDRRRLVQLDFDRDAHVAFARALAEGRRARGESELLATRGERLALIRLTFVFEDADVGPSEIDSLLVLEVDASCRIAAYVRFDPDDLDAAYAELDARFAAGEGAAHPQALASHVASNAAIRSRDWDASAALCAPTFRMRDHRLLGWGTMVNDAATFVRVVRSAVELAPDSNYRHDHLRICARGTLAGMVLCGTRDGGAFENPLLRVTEVDEQGRILCHDTYDESDFDRALARFAEIAAPPASEGRFENAASRAWRTVNAAWTARDLERFAAPHAAALRYRDHRRLFELDLDRAGFLDFTRPLLTMQAGDASLDLVATRGERLALMHSVMEMQDESVGPSVIESMMLIETDERGGIAAYDRWDLEDEEAAWAEIDARFDAGEGLEHSAAAAWCSEFRCAFAGRDWDAMAALQAQDQEAHDHRLVGWGTLRGAGAWTPTLQELVTLAPDVRQRVQDLRLCARGSLWRHEWYGTRDGGAFVSPLLLVVELDERGRQRRLDVWDADRQGAAFARFAEIAAPAASEGRFENAASRAWRAVIDVWRQRDVSRFEALHPRALRYRDRRRLFQLDLDRQGFLDFTRPLLTMRSAGVAIELLATRGERLALLRFTLMMEDETVGPSAIDSLLLVETDGRGDIAAYDRWDLEDEDAAGAALDARWQAGEGAAQVPALAFLTSFDAALARRDWDAVAAGYAPAFVGVDHRLVGWGTLQGPAAFVEAFRTLVALAPDVRLRWDHCRMSSRGMLAQAIWLGTRDGGAFENPFLMVGEFGADGRILRADFYDPHHLDRALARFEEVRASEGLAASVRPNLATASMERNWTAFDVFDLAAADAALDAARAHYAPDFVWDDRRPLVGLSGNLDLMLASVRERLVMGARQQRTIVATAGDRVAIGRVLWAGGPADGRFEVEFLVVSEVDEAGLFTALIFFEPGDTRGAQREAWARWAAIDPAVAPWVDLLNAATDAWNARDRAAILDRFAADVVVEDHRHAGIGRIEGSAAYVDANAVLWDLAPDQRIEFDSSFPAFDRHGLVATLRRVGTLADGGAFESEYVWLSLARDGRITHLELFEVEQQAAALARFEELRPDPLRIPPNAATLSLAPAVRLLANDDLDALRALVTDDFCFDDRTRRSLLRGGVEEWVRALQFLNREARAQLDARLIATAGDRLALYHDTWQEAPGESRFRMESHRLVEIDAAGKLRALVLFDAADRAAALDELFERYAASGGDGSPAAALEFERALNAHDLERVRAVLPRDFVFDDHRRTGLGRLEGPDAYLPSVSAYWELSPDLRIDMLYGVAAAPHGRVGVGRTWGTNAEGGAFESLYVTLLHHPQDRIARIELFEPEDLDAALTRFEELRPDAQATPETAATRMRDRHREAFVARDWDAVRALAGADFVYDDRGKRSLVRGDVQAWIASMEFTTQPGFRSDSTLIGTLGDRIVLDQIRWFGKPDGDAFEFGRVRLLEVGADGLLRAVLFFDPEDRVAASIEGLARFAAGEAAGSAGVAPALALFRALDALDWEAARACFAPDLVLVDHRPLSLGTLDREQWIASLQANIDLAVGLAWDAFRALAWSEQGYVIGIRRLGLIADGGGPFENELYATALVVDGRIQRFEVFGEADAERAVARFAELCAEGIE